MRLIKMKWCFTLLAAFAVGSAWTMTAGAAAPASGSSGILAQPPSDQPHEEPKLTDPLKAAERKDGKKDDKSNKALTGKPTRVAILNFGPPRGWQGKVGNMVGAVIHATAFAHVVPMLEKDNVDVVVIRINSGGGYTMERIRFEKVFQELYKPKFRVVAWVESAISCAAMSPYCIEEFYFLPEGNLGGCTEWSGDMTASKGGQLEKILSEMEVASKLGKRDPKIMRSMQILEPLSYDVDDAGNIVWYQNVSGKHIVNEPGRILTLTAQAAVDCKFAKGIAATPEELVKVMGLGEYEWAGKEATDYIDQNMRDADRTDKRLREVDAEYVMALRAAQQLGGEANKDLRRMEAGKARAALRKMFKWLDVNPNFFLLNGRDKKWFEEQERIIKELLK